MTLSPKERKEFRKLEEIIKTQGRCLLNCEQVIKRYKDSCESNGYRISWAIEEIEHEIEIAQTKNSLRVEELKHIRSGEQPRTQEKLVLQKAIRL